MTNHQIGVALQRIAQLLGSFATQLMQKPSASPNVVPLPTATTKRIVNAKGIVRQYTPKPTVSAPPKLSKRHATIVAKFRKAGIKDPQLFTDIKTFDLWSKDGFAPKKGSKAIHGLFHRSQVQPIG